MSPSHSRADEARAADSVESESWELGPAGSGERLMGLEIEFGSLTVEAATNLLGRAFDAEPVFHSRHSAELRIGGHAPFTVALDTRHALHKADDGLVARLLRDALGDAAALVVPTEITCPPIPLAEAGLLDRIVEALRQGGASGTQAAPHHAFSVQLNPEAAETTPAHVLAILRAYLVVEEHLRAEIDVDPLRSLIGFEARFPLPYQRRILEPGYAPDAAALIDDYVLANPTRNRGLDLLPILAQLDRRRVSARLPDEKIRARPAFHYRLPNSCVDEPGWSPRTEWRRWLAVERLAVDPERLAGAVAERRALLDSSLPELVLRPRLRAVSSKHAVPA